MQKGGKINFLFFGFYASVVLLTVFVFSLLWTQDKGDFSGDIAVPILLSVSIVALTAQYWVVKQITKIREPNVRLIGTVFHLVVGILWLLFTTWDFSIYSEICPILYEGNKRVVNFYRLKIYLCIILILNVALLILRYKDYREVK